MWWPRKTKGRQSNRPPSPLDTWRDRGLALVYDPESVGDIEAYGAHLESMRTLSNGVFAFEDVDFIPGDRDTPRELGIQSRGRWYRRTVRESDWLDDRVYGLVNSILVAQGHSGRFYSAELRQGQERAVMWLSDGEATDVRRNGTEIALDAGHPGAEFFIGARDEFGMIAFRAAQVAVAGPSGLVIRDLASGRRVGVVTSLPDVRAVATAPGGSWFIGGNHRVQRVAPDGSVTEVSLPDTFSVFELTLIGAALYVGGGPTGGGPNLYRLHADTLALQSRWTIFGGGSVTTVEAAGSVLAVAGESPEVALVDPGADGPVALFPGAGGRLAWWTAYDKTRDRLLVSSEAREVFAWVCSERRLLGRIPGVGPVRVSPHGRWYAVSGINGVSVVDPSNLSVVCTLELGEIPESPYKPSINAVEWTPDGRIAVLMDDGRLVLRAFDGSAPTPG